MSDSTPQDWRELCRRAAQELDPEKLLDLVVQINKALDEHARKQKANIDHVIESDTETEALPQQIPSFRILQFGRALPIHKSLTQSLVPA
jgi:hypothetical protein